MENEITREQNNSEYQSVESVGLKKVSEGETGYDNAISIYVKDESGEEIEKMVREKLVEQNWWLQKYWQEKGLPKEQVDIQVGDHKIALYNFGGQLQQQHFDELKKAIEDFSKINNAEPLKQVKYILLDDKTEKNPNTGEEKRGDAGMHNSALQIYPKGTKFDDYRKEETANFKGVSDFEASIIHELSHRVSVDFENKWRDKFHWKGLEKAKENKGGSMSFYETKEPERCVSEYAKLSPSEDICESVVAALKSPDALDPEKLQFIKEELFQNNEPLSVVTDRREGDVIELPNIDLVYYKTEKITTKIIRKKLKKEE